VSKDIELEQWRLSWSQMDEAAYDFAEPKWTVAFKAGLAAQSRRRLWGMLAPVMTTAVIGGYLLLRATRSASWLNIASAIEGGLFIGVVWTGCLWLARATWKPLSESTAAFLDLAIRRAKANLATARLGLSLLSGQLVVGTLIEWIASHSSQHIFTYVTSSPFVVWQWAAIPTYVLWLFWYGRRHRNNLQRLFELRRQLLGRTGPLS
jgi:hypothetical protein